MASTVRIAILANAAQARKELGTVSTAAKGIGDKFTKFRAPAAAALGAIGLGAGKAIQSASDLNETVSKSNQIFGTSAGAINQWAGGAAKNLGLSKQSALESAASFGDMFSQIGFAGGEAANLSKNVVQMSADLGSFNNLPTADVADKISGALRGEYDSLQQIIPNISAARVQQEAMTATGKKSASQLTAQEKATATLAIIQKDGSRAMGDFARTSSGAANSQKIAAASAADLSAQLGQKMLPAYTALLQVGIKFLDFLNQHQTAVAVVVGVLGGLAVALLAASAASTIYNGVLAAQKAVLAISTAAQWAFNAALTANPIGIIIVAVIALVAGLVLLWRNSETFRNVVTAAFTAVKNVAVTVWNAIKVAAVAVWNFLVGYVKFQINIIKAVIKGIVAVASAVWNAIKVAASAVWKFISGYIKFEIDIIKAVIKGIVSVAKSVWNAIKTAASAVWNAMKAGFALMTSSVKDKFNSLKSAASSILSRIKSLFSPSALINAGRQLIQGLANGISERIGAAVDAVRRGVQKIKDLLPGSPIKAGPLKGWNNGGAGKKLMGFLASGISAGAPMIRASMTRALDPVSSLSGAASVSLGVAGGSATRGGGNTYSIAVTVAPGANPIETGRQIVQAIDAYERSGGRRRA